MTSLWRLALGATAAGLALGADDAAGLFQLPGGRPLDKGGEAALDRFRVARQKARFGPALRIGHIFRMMRLAGIEVEDPPFQDMEKIKVADLVDGAVHPDRNKDFREQTFQGQLQAEDALAESMDGVTNWLESAGARNSTQAYVTSVVEAIKAASDVHAHKLDSLMDLCDSIKPLWLEQKSRAPSLPATFTDDLKLLLARSHNSEIAGVLKDFLEGRNLKYKEGIRRPKTPPSSPEAAGRDHRIDCAGTVGDFLDVFDERVEGLQAARDNFEVQFTKVVNYAPTLFRFLAPFACCGRQTRFVQMMQEIQDFLLQDYDVRLPAYRRFAEALRKTAAKGCAH